MSSPEALVDLLHDLQADAARTRAFLVSITSPTGENFTLGIGADTSVCGWVSAAKDPPYFASKGSNEDGPDLVFLYFGEWTDFPAEYGIPVEDAVEAAREFVAEGKRPTTIEWQEV